MKAIHTPGHRNCPACEQLRESVQLSSALPFQEAMALWLDSHAVNISKRTLVTYREYSRRLVEFYTDLPLSEFHIGHLRAYQNERKIAPARINQELRLVTAILKQSALWAPIAAHYKTLRSQAPRVRKNMAPPEEAMLLATATLQPKRALAGHCLRVMMSTSMGFGELRHVRRHDLHLDTPEPYVEVVTGAKNKYRRRTITLNAIAVASMWWILRRWERLGGKAGEDFILPHRAHVRGAAADFAEPMGQIHRAARAIFKDAGLKGFTPYDMRSHAITKLLADPKVSDQVYEELVGHHGLAMRRRYSQQRLEVKKVATDGLCKKPAGSVQSIADVPLFPAWERALRGIEKTC